jgi:hypothetical protein
VIEKLRGEHLEPAVEGEAEEIAPDAASPEDLAEASLGTLGGRANVKSPAEALG